MSDRVHLGLGDDGRIQVTAGQVPLVGISWLSPADARAAAVRLNELADQAQTVPHAPPAPVAEDSASTTKRTRGALRSP